MKSAESPNQRSTTGKDGLSGGAGENSKGDVLLATVKGDIHDIGKNPKVMLENYGFNVIDLGRCEILEEIITKHKAGGTQRSNDYNG